jgi:Mor family transcriptional regulator
MISLEIIQEMMMLEAAGIRQCDLAKNYGITKHTVRRILKERSKRILAISDLHCGHRAGITPPKFQTSDAQAKVWDWYTKTVRMLKPDVVFCLGDCCEGKGKRSGGSELIEVSWKGQIDMATIVIQEAQCKNITMVYGTGYHVGDDDDYEDQVAQNVGAIIKDHAFPICNGIQFDLKHKIGGSSIPHGRATALQKAKMWNAMWNDHDRGQPLANIIMRGHVHYHEYTGNPRGLAMTMPALQGWGSKFGQRQCEGIVDTGLVYFDIRPGDTVDTLSWHSILPKFPHHRVSTYEV